MKKKIPYGRQEITDEDVAAVVEVLQSDWLTQGPKIAEFEKAFAEYIGCQYAVAVSNGTAALHLSALVMDIRPGDKVITTPVTFAATANCVRYTGGEVVFADIDPETYLLDIKEVERLLHASPIGTYKGIIPVDFAGRAVNLEVFRDLADEYGCWIIEDACHAPGGYFIDSKDEKQNCGNGNYADTAIFSFHPVKHIAAGEGGMITTNDEEIYHRLRNLRTHGIQQIPERRKENHGIWYYEMQELGYNYRLTDIHAALGISQLKRAWQNLENRKDIVKRYESVLKGKEFIKALPGFHQGHAYHLYVSEFENRDGLITHLRKNNIFAQVHYIPLHLMPYYKNLGFNKYNLPNSEKYYKYCLSMPIYPSLSHVELEVVIKKIYEFFDD